MVKDDSRVERFFHPAVTGLTALIECGRVHPVRKSGRVALMYVEGVIVRTDIVEFHAIEGGMAHQIGGGDADTPVCAILTPIGGKVGAVVVVQGVGSQIIKAGGEGTVADDGEIAWVGEAIVPFGEAVALGGSGSKGDALAKRQLVDGTFDEATGGVVDIDRQTICDRTETTSVGTGIGDDEGIGIGKSGTSLMAHPYVPIGILDEELTVVVGAATVPNGQHGVGTDRELTDAIRTVSKFHGSIEGTRCGLQREVATIPAIAGTVVGIDSEFAHIGLLASELIYGYDNTFAVLNHSDGGIAVDRVAYV